MTAPAREVRAHVESEQARVRVLVAELVREALQAERKLELGVVRWRLMALREAVERVIEVEEREFIPLLRQADAWGLIRVERLREQHERMLCAVSDFADQVMIQQSDHNLIGRAEQLVSVLWRDLEEEEDALVASQRDEDGTVVVDQESD